MEKQDILTTSKIVSYEEILTYYLNMFRDKLTAGMIDKAHYERLKITDPGYSIVQNGVKLTVDNLIESNRKTMVFAKGNIEFIEKAIKMEKDGSGKEEIERQMKK